MMRFVEDDGCTALMMAVEAYQEEIALQIIAEGASLDVRAGVIIMKSLLSSYIIIVMYTLVLWFNCTDASCDNPTGSGCSNAHRERSEFGYQE